ncbi:tetratricopeptide repeat protein, partial [Planctomycetota bacterium]
MSNWDAEYPYPEPRKTFGGPRLLLVLGAIFVCGLLAIGIIAWRITAVSDDPDEWSPIVETQDEKYAAVAAAFNGDSLGADRRRLKPIRRLFNAIVAASEVEDNAAFTRQIDVNRLFAEMKHSGVMEPLAQLQQWTAVYSVRAGLQVPMCWDRYEIARVDFQANGEEAVVYARHWSPEDEEYPVRWWIVRGNQGWKAYDWNVLDYGIRASKEEAIFYFYQNDPRLDRYFQARQLLYRVNYLMEEGDYEPVTEMMSEIEKLDVLSLLRDDVRLQTGNMWLANGRINRAIACYRRVRKPDAAPGTLHGLALCHGQRGQYARALEFASRYETLLGRSAGVSGMMAEWLLELGRKGEAVEQLQRSLSANPDQIDRLELLGFALDDDRKEVLVDYVRKVADPVETAESLGESFAYGVHNADLAALEVVTRLLAEIAPSSAEKLYLEGLARQAGGDAAAAASFFEQAFVAEDDADKRASYVDDYLDAMTSAGRSVEGYLQAPDPIDAFQYLTTSYEYESSDLSKEAFRQLLDEHQKKHPDDPRVDYHRGNLLAEQEKYDEAEKAYAAAAANAEEEALLSSIRYGWVRVLYAADRGAEAYERIDPPENTLRQLADLYLAERDPEKTAEFELLLQTHGSKCPDDPWLDFHAASLHKRRKNYREADRLFARGGRTAGEEYIASLYRTRRLDARIESGDALAALGEVDPPDETFAYLAEHFASTREWPELESLIERYRQIDESSAELRCREANLHWQRKDYHAVVRLLTPWPNAFADEIFQSRASDLREKLVRCYLRLGHLAAAETLAQAAYEEHGQWLPLVLVYATKGDVRETSQYLAECFASQYTITDAYYDEDVGAILRGDDYLPARRQYPPDLPHNLGRASFVVLSDEVRPPDSDWLARRLAPVIGENPTITEMPRKLQADSHTATLTVAAASGGVCFVTFGRDRLQCDAEFEPSFRGRSLGRAIADHTAWVAVDAPASNTDNEETEFSTVCRLVAALIDEHSLAVYLSDDARLIAVDQQLRDLLQRPNPYRPLLTAGQEAWLYRDTSDDQNDAQAAEQHPRRLDRLFSAFKTRQPDERFLVNVHLSPGFATESHWLAVRRITEGPRGRRRLFAQFTADSHLIPECRRGEPVAVRTYDVLDWKT